MSARAEHFPVWSSSLFNRLNVLHFFTQRQGGVSPPPYDTLNLGFSTKDKPENVSGNRKRVEEQFGIELRSLAIQVHGNKVLVLKLMENISSLDQLPEADAIISNIQGLAVAVFFADCLPIFIWDPAKKAGGLVHAGWRSTIQDVGPRSIEAVQNEFGSNLENLFVAFGPSIGPCCFEVGPDVSEPFERKFGKGVVLERNAKRFVNLWEANRQALVSKGVKGANMELAEECTSCQRSKYFSYRRDKGDTGRMAGVIRIPG